MEEFELYRDLGMLAQVITYNVLDDGSFREDLPFFGGTAILNAKGKEGSANKAVIDKLAESGGLLARGKITHSYPHSWRSKAPVIYRNTHRNGSRRLIGRLATGATSSGPPSASAPSNPSTSWSSGRLAPAATGCIR